MDRRLLKCQVAVLAVGTAFAWLTLIGEYRRFFMAGGRVLELSGCVVTNPLLTPCFYGAWAFLAALAWAALILRSAPSAMPGHQRKLNVLLAAGTLFAWSNFGYELYQYVRSRPMPAFSCPPPGDSAANPLTAPCFYGALIFLAALLISVSILRRARRSDAGLSTP